MAFARAGAAVSRVAGRGSEIVGGVRSRVLKSGVGVPVRGLSATADASGADIVRVDRVTDDGIAFVVFDDPTSKVNTLSRRTMASFASVMEKVEQDSSICAVILKSGKEGSWIAGADVNVLDELDSSGLDALVKEGQEAMDRLEHLKKPIVAAIQGDCLGGGAEVALACHYRVASTHPKTKIGFPEVQLGLLPGAGGTQRLPRLVGIQQAILMMTTGQRVNASKAKRSGLVDVAADPAALENAALFAARGLADGSLKKSKGKKKALFAKVLEDNPVGRAILFPQAEKAIAKKAKKDQYPSPYAVLECVKAGVEQGHKKGSEIERKRFVELADTPTSRSLRGIFFGMTASKKAGGKSDRQINTLGVVGAGLMGAGIAEVSLGKGIRVLLKDADDAGLARGEAQIRESFAKKEKKRRVSHFEAERTLSDVVGLTDKSPAWKSHFSKADVVVEAVPEVLEIKHKVFGEIASLVSKDAILATNTSAIPIADVAGPLPNPERVIGLHYFSPVPQMPLVEVIPHAGTSDDVTAAACALGRKQGKTVIVVGDVPGFYVNRILAPSVMDETSAILAEGVDAKRLDKAMTDFGWPMGPPTLADSVGADVALHVHNYMAKSMPEHMTAGSSAGTAAMVEAGLLGKKTGKGFFEYDSRGRKKGGRDAQIHPETQKLISKLTGGKVVGEDKLPNEELAHRITYRFVAQALRCLEEGVIANPTDGDIGAVFGVGFPPFRGGPFKMIDELGADKVRDRFLQLRDKYGDRFEPPQILTDYANSNKKFR